VLLGATSILATSAGFFDNKYLTYASACSSTVCLAMLRFSAYAHKESVERNEALTQLLRTAGLAPMPDPGGAPPGYKADPGGEGAPFFKAGNYDDGRSRPEDSPDRPATRFHSIESRGSGDDSDRLAIGSDHLAIGSDRLAIGPDRLAIGPGIPGDLEMQVVL
jgi:hypothetical protein